MQTSNFQYPHADRCLCNRPPENPSGVHLPSALTIQAPLLAAERLALFRFPLHSPPATTHFETHRLQRSRGKFRAVINLLSIIRAAEEAASWPSTGSQRPFPEGLSGEFRSGPPQAPICGGGASLQVPDSSPPSLTLPAQEGEQDETSSSEREEITHPLMRDFDPLPPRGERTAPAPAARPDLPAGTPARGGPPLQHLSVTSQDPKAQQVCMPRRNPGQHTPKPGRCCAARPTFQAVPQF